MPTIVNPTLPNILTNGTTADATQVMADFAFIISQINTNAAENGANASITSLTGLTTPLSPSQGGTGLSDPVSYAVMMGAAGAAMGTVLPAAAGTVLASNGTAAFASFQALTSLISAANLESILGFTPVQQGTGVGQTTNVVKIGWSGSNNAKITIDTSDEGFIVMAPTISGGQYQVTTALNDTAGLFDNGNRVWSPGNLQPLQYNTIGSYQIFLGINVAANTTFAAPAGFSGTWLSQGILNTGAGGSGICTHAVRVA